MVDLPKVPIPDTVTQPVRTSISSAEVAAPYAEIAHGLNKAGEQLTEVSVDLAQKAGEQSVRTDDSGNPVVDRSPLPMVGPAATAYARAARLTYAGKIQPQIENDLLQLRLAHPNDPQGFQTAAKAYGEEKLGQIDDPTLKVGIGKMIGQDAAHNYRTSLVDANQQNTTEAMQTYQARIKDMNERGATLARQGGTDTPEYQSLAHDRAALYKELGDDPRFKFSPERAALEMRENRDQDVGQAVIGQAQRIFQTKQNAAEAQKFLRDAFWGEGSEKLNLSVAKRDHFVAEGMHALDNISAIDRQAIADNAAATNSYIEARFKNPALHDEGSFNDMLQRSRSIGDIKSEQNLIRYHDLLPTATNLKKMGPEQATVALGQMTRGNLPDNISFAGIPDKFIAGIKQSEGFQPRAQWDYKQFTNGYGTRAMHSAEVIDKETADRRFDQEISKAAKIVDSVNPTLDAGTRAALTSLTFNAGSSWVNGTLGQRIAAGDIAGARNVFLGYNRAGGQILPGLVNRRTQEASWFGQDEAPGTTQMRPGEHVDLATDNGISRQFQNLVKIQQARTAKFAEEAYGHIEQAVKDKDEFAPGELETFAEAAHLTGRDDLLEKANGLLREKDAREGLPSGSSAVVMEQQIKALEASGVSGVERSMLKKLHENVKSDAIAMKADPIGQGAKNQWFAANNELHPENTQAFLGELQDRVRKAGLLKQHAPDIGPVSLIGKDEAAELGNKLTQGDPAQAMQALKALKTLPDENYLPTMVALKDPIINMSRSNDPMRFAAGNTTMATLWKTHPAEFVPIYGEGALHRVLAYQALQGTFSAAEVVERMNAADDPSKAQSRENMSKAVDTERDKATPNDIADKLGTSWRITPAFIGRMTGSTSRLPIGEYGVTDDIASGQMKNDYYNTYKALRMYGVPQDQAQAKAVEGMKSEWQPSQVAGKALMKHAPETYYPEIGGSHDWMKTDLEAHIESIMGPQISAVQGAENTFHSNWSFKGLLSDDQTADDVKTGRSPTYRIAITDERGQFQFLTDPATGSRRFAWDAKAPLAAYQERQRGVFTRAQADIAESRRRAAEGGQPGLVLQEETPNIPLVPKPRP